MKTTVKNLIYIIKYIWSFSKSFVLITLVVTLSGVVNSILSIVSIKVIMDTLSNSLELKTLILFLIFQMVFIFTNSIINSWYNNIFQPSKREIFSKNIREAIFKKTSTFEYSKYEDVNFYNEYIFSMTNADTKALGIFNTIVSMFGNLVRMFILGTAMVFVDKKLIIFSILPPVVNVLINIKISKISYNMNRNMVFPSRKKSYITRVFYLKDFAKDLRLTNIFSVLINHYNDAVSQILAILKDNGKKVTLYQIMQSTLQIFISTGYTIYLIMEVILGKINISIFLSVLNSINQFSSNVANIFSGFPLLYENSLFIDNFKNFMEQSTEENEITQINLKLGEFKNMQLVNVSFKYPNTNSYVLKNINFKIEKGQKIAIVGLNGSGKTTLVNLILRLYNPSIGQILLNNNDYRSYTSKSLNKCINAISQDYQIYSLPIKDNILMGNTNSNYFSLNDSLKSVGLYEKIQSLPNNVNTYISRELSEEGFSFSGGEAQKIALARLLINDYNLIILDEPTSSLDVKSEALVYESVFNRYKDETIILISHRLSNIKNMDIIYYLEDGEIVEFGKHEELILNNKKYAKLYNYQASKY